MENEVLYNMNTFLYVGNNCLTKEYDNVGAGQIEAMYPLIYFYQWRQDAACIEG